MLAFMHQGARVRMCSRSCIRARTYVLAFVRQDAHAHVLAFVRGGVHAHALTSVRWRGQIRGWEPRLSRKDKRCE